MFDGSPTAQSPAQIARAVRFGTRLQTGEADLARLKARKDQIGAEIGRLNGARTNRDPTTANIDLILELDRERAEVIEKLTPIRREVVEMRSRRAANVRQALAPLITAAAKRMLEAAVTLREGFGEISAINHELARAHAEQIFVLPPELDILVARLARLAG